MKYFGQAEHRRCYSVPGGQKLIDDIGQHAKIGKDIGKTDD